MTDQGPPIPTVHVITALTIGGAETMLARLLETLPADEFPATVIALQPGGPVRERIAASGTPVLDLGIRGAATLPAGSLRLRRLVKRLKPRVVQGWLNHGNVAAWFAGRVAGGTARVAWNVRQSLYDLSLERPGTRLAIRLGARLSRRIPAVIYNSSLAREQYEQHGFRPLATRVIPNGVDGATFHPDPGARASLRAELGVRRGEVLVGLVARYHPMKGHVTLLEATRRVVDQGMEPVLVLAGRDVTEHNLLLTREVSRQGLEARVRMLGERSDIPRLLAGVDVLCSASAWGEGFPNVVAEAMAAGTPCVVTDVGDTRVLIGREGWVVPPGDALALAHALGEAVRLDPAMREAMGLGGRQRVLEHYSLARVAEAYAGFYRQLASGAPFGPGAERVGPGTAAHPGGKADAR